MTEPLFEVEPTQPVAVESDGRLSADRRRTLRQKADVERGIHPLTRFRIHDDPTRTCGNCRFRQLLRWHNRSFPKCTRDESRLTHSGASDVRAWWPGCTDHEWGDPKLSPDAARYVP